MTTSGAIQKLVPTPAVIVLSDRSREAPKSVILAFKVSVSKIFLDLRSRCSTTGSRECK
ncbi:hypothetical protein JG687_00018844 [Phytophthora cactorum]|uniref:Uncharacterized protein n=2 Tax=Phytophthora TaxID=4783 RepID=A0A8J5MCE4_9STRA|nr:hypothetical protein JG687_00018844 [Phytophthora cactorum]KAG6945544.1 hypothetical protein JG688_00016506 [Phytophthora aleatoria]